MGFFPKEIMVYAAEVIVPKNRFLIPRAEVGTHLEYEKPIRSGGVLRFHLERNLRSLGADRYTVPRLYASVEQDFRALAALLTSDLSFQSVTRLEGITNFEEKTGKRFGFDSRVIIDSPILCIPFDNRIDKPELTRNEIFSAPPIRRFWIERERFLELYDGSKRPMFQSYERS